jgi:hypothetical protein
LLSLTFSTLPSTNSKKETGKNQSSIAAATQLTHQTKTQQHRRSTTDQTSAQAYDLRI